MKSLLFTFLFLGLLAGCATQQQTVQQKPPGMLGRMFDNTVSRYNAYYNSSLVYKTSIASATDGFQEDYDALFAASVQDAVARDGSVSGQMDEIIEKTTAIIEKKPYSKWVDDHFLMNGIAHYIKGDYEMSEKIFRYVSSEFQQGVQDDRVTSRQKIKGLDNAKERRDEAKEKLKEVEEIKKEREQEAQEKEKEVRLTAKERAKEAKRLKKRNQRLKKQAVKEVEDRKKEGRAVDAQEIVREIKEREREVTKQKDAISDADRERLANAPVLKNDESMQKEGLLAHELAAKDALLWLAKTYITTEKFIAANAVLTAINEDEYFPIRLNTDYYLTYADMHIRLENMPKAAEYVQLAADSAQRKEKGRLYYLLGQLYSEMQQWDKAEEAFNTVEKFHPYYDMIYHAKMNNIDRAFQEGKFENQDFVTPLKRMTRDAKNDDFLDEVYYYLGEAYTAQGDIDKAVESYQKSLEAETSDDKVKKKTFSALAYEYYRNRAFKQAQPNFEEALALMQANTAEHTTTALYTTRVTSINQNIDAIYLQDSLLVLAEMTDEELQKFIEKKVKQEIRDEFRDKLQETNASFGNNQVNTNRNRRDRNSESEEQSGFYFYDLQQATLGYTQFKQEWGSRPNVDNWRRSQVINRVRKRAQGAQKEQYEEAEISTEEQRIANYLGAIPRSDDQKQTANNEIFSAYQNLIQIFDYSLGDEEMASFYKQELARRNPPSSVLAGLKDRELQAVDSSREPPETTRSEIEQLYDLAYDAYVEGNFNNALVHIERSGNFQNNAFADKFAFIRAMSMGKLEGENVLATELEQFTQNFPASPLTEQALNIINQQ